MQNYDVIRWTAGDGPINRGPLVCAIGNFDAVHKGHQHLIEQASQMAVKQKCPLAIITFAPHPRQYFQPSGPAFLLMQRDLKNRLLAQQGANLIIEVTFNEEIQMMPAQTFVEQVLIQALNVVHLFAGADFAFGKGRAGKMESLAQNGQHNGMTAHAVQLLHKNAATIVSSTAIREAITAGNLGLAEELLGRPVTLSGPVITGDMRGRKLDFPTANIALEPCLSPPFGVYAILADLDDGQNSGKKIKGVANIGRRPTVNDRGILAEAHLFDFDADIYGCELTLYLKRWLRAEQKFDGIDALRAQISKDVAQAQKILLNLA